MLLIPWVSLNDTNSYWIQYLKPAISRLLLAMKIFEGHLGHSVTCASAFGSGRHLRVLGGSPALGILFRGEYASPTSSAPPPQLVLSLSHSHSQISK